jgi:molecular chaperone DnaK
MSETIIGIDLGTTNSEVGVVKDGKVHVFEINGSPIMPSCVGIDPSGNLIVGQAAKNQMVAAAESTVLSIKRKMGEETKVSLGPKQYSPEEISSFILRELKKEAEKQLGRPVAKAVITVPAFFNESQRKATQVAGELAGLEVVRILNEPTAAALAYGAGNSDDHVMLVYDLGGGTFDVSVVVAENGVVEVKSSHGDTHLGGDDFDQLLVNHAIQEFKKRNNIDLQTDLKTMRRLKVIMEKAKRQLTDEPFATIREEYIDGQRHLEMEIQRHEYEDMIVHLIEKTLDCVHQSLSDAKLTPKDVNKVMLVGGATRTPLVQRMLHERMQIEPRFEINPDLIVAMGAAVQGGVIAGEKQHSILVDITPHTFSTTALGPERSEFGSPQLICVPLIPRNTPLPASKSELFYTIFDGQKEVNVQAYQGENILPEQNTFIGDFMVSGLSNVPSGNPILLHFDLDLNGLLKVTATEKNTGLSKSVVMDTRGKATLNLEDARKNIEDLAGEDVGEDEFEIEEVGQDKAGAGAVAEDATGESTKNLIATAKDLRKRAEAMLEKNISEEDALEIRDLVHQSAQTITDRDWEGLKAKNETLSDLLFYLED